MGGNSPAVLCHGEGETLTPMTQAFLDLTLFLSEIHGLICLPFNSLQ